MTFQTSECTLNAHTAKKIIKTSEHAPDSHLLPSHINVRTALCGVKYDYDINRPFYCPLFDFFAHKKAQYGRNSRLSSGKLKNSRCDDIVRDIIVWNVESFVIM